VVTPDELMREAEDAIEQWYCELDSVQGDIIADGERRADELVAEAAARAESLAAAARNEAEEIVGEARLEARRIVEEAVAVADRLRNDTASDIAHLRLVVASLESGLTDEAAERGITRDADGVGSGNGDGTDGTDGADSPVDSRPNLNVAAGGVTSGGRDDAVPPKRWRGLRRLFGRSHD
jgi:vacuolar-type H+-ATPase subunit H